MSKIDIQIDSFQAILFDFDGVLCECTDVKTEAFAKLFESFGEEVVKKVVDHHVKHGGISRYKKIKFYYKEYLNERISDEKLNELAQRFSELVVNKVIASDWVKGAKEFLEKYYKNIDLYVVSGTPQKELKLIIEKRNMRRYFKGVFGTPETKPEIAKRLISNNNYNRDKVLYIGDSLSDYYDSQKAGIKFLGRLLEKMTPKFPETVKIIRDFNDVL